MRWFGASEKLSLIYRNMPFILLLSDFNKLQGHFLFPSTVKKMKLKQTRISSGNEVKHLPCGWYRTDVTAAAAGLEEEEWTHSEPWHPMHWTALLVQVDLATQPRDHRWSSCREQLQNSIDFLLVELDSASGDSASDLSMQVWPTAPRNLSGILLTVSCINSEHTNGALRS